MYNNNCVSDLRILKYVYLFFCSSCWLMQWLMLTYTSAALRAVTDCWSTGNVIMHIIDVAVVASTCMRLTCGVEAIPET